MTKNKLVKELNKFYATLATEDSAYNNCYVTKEDLKNMDCINAIMYDLEDNCFTYEDSLALYREVKNYKKNIKIKIRKALSMARKIFLVAFGVCLLFAIISADGESLMLPLVCFGVGAVCFCISYAIDWLLVSTAWSGDKSSPFYH